MKNYDYLKAKKLIEENKDKISEAILGMSEDWFWTAETVFENGNFVIDLEEKGLCIAGISGSYWATPIIELVFKNGSVERHNCFTGTSDGTKPAFL